MATTPTGLPAQFCPLTSFPCPEKPPPWPNSVQGYFIGCCLQHHSVDTAKCFRTVPLALAITCLMALRGSAWPLKQTCISPTGSLDCSANSQMLSFPTHPIFSVSILLFYTRPIEAPLECPFLLFKGTYKVWQPVRFLLYLVVMRNLCECTCGVI